MSVPAYVNDGNFNIPQQNGWDEFSLPFFNRGDGISFEVRQKWRVTAAKFVPPKLMQPKTFNVTSGFSASFGLQFIAGGLGLAYLVDVGEAYPVENGLVEYVLTYASVPVKRTEATNVAYPYQFLRSQLSFSQGFGPEAGEVIEPSVSSLTLNVAASVVYEYFLEPPQPLSAPRVEVFNGIVVYIAGWGALPPNQPFLAFDAEIGIYKCRIFYRRSVYVNALQYSTQSPAAA